MRVLRFLLIVVAVIGMFGGVVGIPLWLTSLGLKRYDRTRDEREAKSKQILALLASSRAVTAIRQGTKT